MIKKVDPDRIINDCTYVIEHLKWRIDLQPELSKAFYYRGRAGHHKGVVDLDIGYFGNAEHDFAQVAHNHNADPHIHAMALYYCGVCWKKLRQPKHSEDYFAKALNEFDKIANNPKTDYDMRAKALYYCAVCCNELCYNERAECYFERAEESGFVDEPQPHYLGSIVQKAENLKKRVIEELGITEGPE